MAFAFALLLLIGLLSSLLFAVVNLFPRFFGIVQAGWRAVLADIGEELTRPSTPKGSRHARATSLGSVDGNSFTKVPLDYAVTTPGRKKRSLEAIDGEEDGREVKRQAR